MASVIFHSGLSKLLTGDIDVNTDTFKVMISTNTYSENKDTHDFRDDVTNEVSGTGYTAGGNTVTLSVSIDATNDRVEISLGGTTWPSSTITGARKFTYYKSRGGAASADELLCTIDNGADVSTVAGTLTLNASTLRIQN
jgi:hypothetical protein